MKLIDHFDDILVLEGPERQGDALCAELHRRGVRPWRVDLSAPSPWRAWPGHGAWTEAAPSHGGLDVLVLAGCFQASEAFWATQDGLVEQLESCALPLVVLAHADGQLAQQGRQAPRLLLADGMPARPQALAMSRSLLRQILAILPDHGCTSPFTAEDWLTLALGLAPAASGRTLRPLAWPSLGRPVDDTEVPRFRSVSAFASTRGRRVNQPGGRRDWASRPAANA